MKIKKALTLSLLSIILLTQANAKEKIYKLKLATTWGSSAVPLINASKNLASYVEKMSNGRLLIRVDSANKHKSPFGVFDMVKAGSYDMAHTSSYFYKGKDINMMPFTTMPFALTAPELNAWFYHAGGLDLMKKVYSKHGILAYPGGNTGVQMGGWFKEEIKTLDDLKGLKMRIPGFAGEIMTKLGVLVTNIAPGDLYTSLERGTIDALEWVGPGMDIKMGFHKVANYYYTGWHEPGPDTQFYINKKKFNKLPKDLQMILEVAMKASSSDMYTYNYHLSGLAWSKMKKDYPSIQIKSFSKEIVKELKKENQKLITKIKSKNPLFNEIITSQENYLKQVRPWTIISDYLYIKENKLSKIQK
ncbi:MAG: TRAP transporter substrate-binding protein DctP [Campylobacteraceae bacterium]|nr:TRAP transporter substrate-binding protein DctP [Campylobacteraceae bacterium]